MKTKLPAAPQASLAAVVAGEDLAIGEYVAVLVEIREYLSMFWIDCARHGLSPHETVRVPFMPPGAGEPLKIEAICLPFVFVKPPSGEHRTLDIRMVRLAKLDTQYAKFVLKSTKRPRPLT